MSVGTGYVNMTSDEKTVEWGGMLGTIIGRNYLLLYKCYVVNHIYDIITN